MQECSRCGSQLPEAARFCPSCGAAVERGDSRGSAHGEDEPPVRTEGPSPNDRNWAVLCHVVSFVGFVVPLGNIIGPLLVWLLRRADSPFIDLHGKEAVNFQISLTIYVVLSGLLVLALIGFLLLPVVLVFGIVVVIMAALRANAGLEYRYPMTIRLLK